MKIEKYLSPEQPKKEDNGWVVYAVDNKNVRLLSNGEMHEYCTGITEGTLRHYKEVATAFYVTRQEAYTAAVYYIANSCYDGSCADEVESTVMVFD